MAYGARLLSGLRVTPSRGFKSRHLRQIPTAPSRLPRWAGAVRVPGLVRVRASPLTGSGADLSRAGHDGLGLLDGASSGSLPDGVRATYPPTLNSPIVVIVTGCSPTGTPSR